MADAGWYLRFVRRKLADHDPQKLNKLDNYEEKWTDDDLLIALETALMTFNDTPPETPWYCLENFPWPSLLIKGAVIEALFQAAANDTKNKLQYSDAGLTVAEQVAAQDYLVLANQLAPEYREMVIRTKGTIIPRSPGAGFIVISSPFDFSGCVE